MTDKERAKLYSDSFNAAIADRDRLKAEVERLQGRVERMNTDALESTAGCKLASRLVEAQADRDRLRGALKACEVQLGEYVEYHHKHDNGCSIDMESAWLTARAALADGDGEGGQG